MGGYGGEERQAGVGVSGGQLGLLYGFHSGPPGTQIWPPS